MLPDAVVTKAIKMLGTNPSCRLITLSATEAQTRRLTAEVRTGIESAAVQAAYPGLRIKEVLRNGDFVLDNNSWRRDRSLTGAFPGCPTLGCRAEVLLLDTGFDAGDVTVARRANLAAWIRCSVFTRMTRHSSVEDGLSSVSSSTLVELIMGPVLRYPEGALGPELLALLKLLREY